MSASTSVMWSREEEKSFENAIAMHWIEDSKEQWAKIGAMVPTKTIEQLQQHYQLLVEDVNAIESGLIPLPKYVDEAASTSSTKDNHGFSSGQQNTTNRRLNSNYSNGLSGFSQDSSGPGTKGSSRSEQERRKGIPWTEEEHR